jgi:Fis family transcriptional regulator
VPKKQSPTPGKNSDLNGSGKLVQSRNKLLKNFTEDALGSYFGNLNGHKPINMYKLVLGEVEPPLLQKVMDYSEGNQTVAAEILGINRATLRKKLKHYRISN